MKGRLQVLLALELFLVVTAFVAVLLPRRGTTDLIHLPPDLVTYLKHVAILFGSMNGLIVVMAGVGWVVWIARGRPYLGPGDRDSAAKEP